MSIAQLIAMITIFTSVWGGSMWVVNSNTQSTIERALRNQEDTLKNFLAREIKKNENVWTVSEILELANEQQQKNIQDLIALIKKENRKQSNDFKNYIETERLRYDTLYYKTPQGRYYRVIQDLKIDSIGKIEVIDKNDIR